VSTADALPAAGGANAAPALWQRRVDGLSRALDEKNLTIDRLPERLQQLGQGRHDAALMEPTTMHSQQISRATAVFLRDHIFPTRPWPCPDFPEVEM